MTDMIVQHPETRRVIIFGDCWPVVSALENVVLDVNPDCSCKTTYNLSTLVHQLTCEQQALLILCLRPREHIFLFYALKEELIYHPTMVISDELFLSDRLILSTWGKIPCMLHQELKVMITSQQLRELSPSNFRHCPEKSMLTDFLVTPALPSGFSEVPQIFHLKERLMDYMSLLMYREMLNRGLTPFRMRLLEAIWTGHQTRKELAEMLNEPMEKIWNEKHRLLTQLGMPARLRDILYGTRFCLFLQKTPFMPLNKAESIREIARASEPAVTPDFPTGTSA